MGSNTRTNARSPEDGLAAARKALLSLQKEDGHWCFPLEADCTIPAEYVLMMHFMDDVDAELESKIARFIREKQDLEHGGWPLYYGGHFDLSCTIKAYYALKIVGDSPDAPHMTRARAAILNHGGAARANVFTRHIARHVRSDSLARRSVCACGNHSVAQWFPFHLSKVAYWSRAVTVPLSILCSLKARAANPRNVHIRELFTVAPEEERNYFSVRTRSQSAVPGHRAYCFAI